jgi:hypothetical protein
VEAKMGNLTTMKEAKAKLSFETVAVPFYIPVADIAERFNFKQENC